MCGRYGLIKPHGEIDGVLDVALDPESGPGDLRELLMPYDASEMEAYEVSSLLNESTNEIPDAASPVSQLVQAPAPNGASVRPATPSPRPPLALPTRPSPQPSESCRRSS